MTIHLNQNILGVDSFTLNATASIEFDSTGVAAVDAWRDRRNNLFEHGRLTDQPSPMDHANSTAFAGAGVAFARSGGGLLQKTLLPASIVVAAAIGGGIWGYRALQRNEIPSSVSSTGRAPDPVAGNRLVRRERMENAGDPAFGRVVHIREIHGVPTARIQTYFPDPQQARRIVGGVTRYQYEILRYLEERGAGVLFADGLTRDLYDRLFSPLGRAHRLIAPHFTALPASYEETTSDQRFHLFEGGAWACYFTRHPSALLFPGDDPRIFEEGWSSMTEERLRAAPQEEAHYFEAREEWVMRRVLEYLNEHPGKTVYLIYGSRHEFRDNFRRLERSPRLESVWWRIQLPGLELPEIHRR